MDLTSIPAILATGLGALASVVIILWRKTSAAGDAELIRSLAREERYWVDRELMRQKDLEYTKSLTVIAQRLENIETLLEAKRN